MAGGRQARGGSASGSLGETDTATPKAGSRDTARKTSRPRSIAPPLGLLHACRQSLARAGTVDPAAATASCRSACCNGEEAWRGPGVSPSACSITRTPAANRSLRRSQTLHLRVRRGRTRPSCPAVFSNRTYATDFGAPVPRRRAQERPDEHPAWPALLPTESKEKRLPLEQSIQTELPAHLGERNHQVIMPSSTPRSAQ